MSHILIIEDEKPIVRLIAYNLERHGFKVASTYDGETGLAWAQKGAYDLVILDLMLPKMNGLEVCRSLRKVSMVPILILTAKNEELDRIIGLEMGADDYVTKPFSIRELIARIKTLLRRSRMSDNREKELYFGDLSIDLERYTTTLKSKPIHLSTREFTFLRVLIEANGKALNREQLLERVWGQEASADIDTRTIDQHIARLRDKLGSEAKRIITVKNVGYRFQTEP